MECLYWEDFATREVLQKMSNHLGQDRVPYFLLVNKEGVIVNYGSALRPSWPETAVQIDGWKAGEQARSRTGIKKGVPLYSNLC